MNRSTTKGLAFFGALLVSLTACAGFVFIPMLLHTTATEWETIALSFVAIFIISYFLLLLLAQKLIDTRIQKLYKTIRFYRTGKQEQVIPANKSDLIDQIYKEISAWSDERKKEIDRLQKLEVYRREFLGNVSHELKTPVFNIQGYILTLLDGAIDDPAINKNYLARTESSIDRMIAIIDDLEAISQLETGEMQLDPEDFDITHLIKEVFEAQELRATAKGIILHFKDKDVQPIFVSADKFRIRQVVTNLIVNSVNYGKEYGETSVKITDMGEKVVIDIEDNGIGIPEEHLPRLFERFYRVDKGRSREQGGTGLGLAIVKHIIEAHHQSIKVKSTVGTGTMFTFTLKKAEQAAP